MYVFNTMLLLLKVEAYHPVRTLELRQLHPSHSGKEMLYQSFFFFFFTFLVMYLFIWLHWIRVDAHGIFNLCCGTRDLSLGQVGSSPLSRD